VIVSPSDVMLVFQDQGFFLPDLACMGSGPFCRLWVWRRGIDRWPCYPSPSAPSTSLWSAWLDGSG